jgi:hypothetical protein
MTIIANKLNDFVKSLLTTKKGEESTVTNIRLRDPQILFIEFSQNICRYSWKLIIPVLGIRTRIYFALLEPIRIPNTDRDPGARKLTKSSNEFQPFKKDLCTNAGMFLRPVTYVKYIFHVKLQL